MPNNILNYLQVENIFLNWMKILKKQQFQNNIPMTCASFKNLHNVFDGNTSKLTTVE